MATTELNGIDVYVTDVTGTVTSFIRESALSAGELAFVEAASVIAVDQEGFSTIAAQTNADFDGVGDNGTFVAGTTYVIGDVITMSDGTTVTVATLGGGDGVATFTITTASTPTTRGVATGATLTQASVLPAGGTGFTMTLDVDNELEYDDTVEQILAVQTFVPSGQNAWVKFGGYVETYDSAAPRNVIAADLVTGDLAVAVARINVIQDFVK